MQLDKPSLLELETSSSLEKERSPLLVFFQERESNSATLKREITDSGKNKIEQHHISEQLEFISHLIVFSRRG